LGKLLVFDVKCSASIVVCEWTVRLKFPSAFSCAVVTQGGVLVGLVDRKEERYHDLRLRSSRVHNTAGEQPYKQRDPCFWKTQASPLYAACRIQDQQMLFKTLVKESGRN
jgi:hypothetical protein